jgi:glutathione peroxidase
MDHPDKPGDDERNGPFMSVYDFTAARLDGHDEKLSDYRGRVLLIVNTASECGFTPQYAGLETLYEKFESDGLTILGFPCNQFGRQEPGSEAAIGQFCQRNYGVTFPLFAKIEVNGAHAHPLYKYLKEARPGLMGSEAIKWNFTKFLIGRDGEPVARYAPQTKPEELEAPIRKLLSEN